MKRRYNYRGPVLVQAHLPSQKVQLTTFGGAVLLEFLADGAKDIAEQLEANADILSGYFHRRRHKRQ